MYGRPYYRQENWNLPSAPFLYQQGIPSLTPSSYPKIQQTPYDYFAKNEQPIDLINQITTSGARGYQQEQQNPTGMFTNEQGQLDFDKTLSAVGQLANTYHQVSPIVKQLGSIINILR